MEHEDALLATIRLQGAGFRGWGALGSPFYADLCDELALDVERDGPIAHVLAPFADAPFESAYVLRLLGGIHRMVLSGAAPEVAAHFPSTGGDGDAGAAIVAIAALLAEPPAEVLDALTRPPQTNEVARSAALASGMLTIARETRLPLRLREIGSSGGLNLRPDAYWYEQDGNGWGTATSPVRFVDLWPDGAPPFVPGATIIDRRGCDRDPIDASADGGALTLLSYIWPDPESRFTRARAAIEIARGMPVAIDRADAVDWLGAQLAEPARGSATVVFHSIVWQYLGDEAQAGIRAALDAAGRRATPDAPLAWLRLEPHPETYAPAQLHLTLWDGRVAEPAPRLLATTGFHGGAITWLDHAAS
jgi:hypothetical protein